ncbi:hypothetical protein E3T55_05480 [Cryobacterium frigoriphilum]|uniref:PBP domain-containing protein n=1 Tax=Cryobacterium frigoriphilum TaxID=1259150 RepID=A0A4R9A785_9MICO|nr:substrate-binding domain-containing protein [Cryobacterium frigoriphilum]TFD53464.1 hypothetical protein E3T55_05480 [Cryobacterium frigoriphilum]
MQKKNQRRLGLIAGLALVGVAFGTIPAFADPAAGTYAQLSGTGSDTTQDLVGGLATAVTAIGNYDAVGTETIQTKAGGPSFVRPNGSGNGVKALSASINSTGIKVWNGVDITGQLDFARSSSGPKGSGTDLTYIPFAKDAVTYAVNAGGDFPRDIPVGSSSQDSVSPAPFTLRNIYRCTVTEYSDADFTSVPIRALLPQTGSGTRSFWLSTLGLTEDNVVGCATDIGNTVQEHSGAQVTGIGDIVPFSIAQYLAQGNHNTLPTTVAERRYQVALGSIGGAKPVINNGGVVELNSAFPISRNVYNVVATSRLSGTSAADLLLQATFAGTSSTICSNTALIKQYGFGSAGSLCGNTTTYKSPYTL